METMIVEGRLQLDLDPLSVYNFALPSDYLEVCGLPLHWAIEWMLQPQPRPHSLKQYLEHAYAFGPLHPMPSGAALEELRFTYPGDPPLSPYVRLTSANDGTATFIQYPHAIVAVLETNLPTFLTRMD